MMPGNTRGLCLLERGGSCTYGVGGQIRDVQLPRQDLNSEDYPWAVEDCRLQNMQATFTSSILQRGVKALQRFADYHESARESMQTAKDSFRRQSGMATADAWATHID